MWKTEADLLFALLRSEMLGQPISGGDAVSEEQAVKLYHLSQKHDITHLLANGLTRNHLVDDQTAEPFVQSMMMAVYRSQQQTAALKKIRGWFQEEKIAFIPLKGMVLQNLYPAPWMRTSCDIDILIHKKDFSRAKDLLTRNGYQTDSVRHHHDMSFYDDQIHVELHFSLCKNDPRVDGLLKKAWDYAVPYEGYEYRQTNEFLVFYHVAHTAIHFMRGGCGIRPILDLWLLRRQGAFSEDKLLEFLEESRLTSFYRSVCELGDVWMGEAEHSMLTRKMQAYILQGGAYGNHGNRVSMGIARSKDRKFLYMLRIAFLPYQNMCVFYPVLIRHKILLPLCYVHRIFSKLFGKDRKHTKKQIGKVVSRSQSSVTFAKEMLDELNLL